MSLIISLFILMVKLVGLAVCVRLSAQSIAKWA